MKGSEHVSNRHRGDTGQQSLARVARPRKSDVMAGDLEIIGGPTPIPIPRDGDMYRFKVLNDRAEQHVYVQIASSLRAESFEEPLRSGIESKGESVLRKLLERGSIPTRIKITSAGITVVSNASSFW